MPDNRKTVKAVRAVPRRSDAGRRTRKERALRDPSPMLDLVRQSAKDWRGAQLGVLGLVSAVGVIKGQDKLSSLPPSLSFLAIAAAVGAFACACVGTFLVSRTAWPLYTVRPLPSNVGQDDQGDWDALMRAARDLRMGVILTYVAASLLALAVTCTWWP